MPGIQSEYDLIIIGGGINGAAIARDAALRGLSTLLLEKEDYACGASSKSSKLAHGGLRYLEYGELGLVRESLLERNRLIRAAPHLVTPLPFLFPVYTHSARPLWMVNAGLWAYDFLDSGSPMPWHSKLSIEEVHKRFPHLNAQELTGACLYYDAQMQDHRLLMENILDAHKLGAHLWNHTAVTGFIKEGEHVVGVRYKSAIYDWEGEARAPHIVNATGAWSNLTRSLDDPDGSPFVRPTKGVHIIVDLPPPEASWILAAPQDNRIFFLMPWEKQTLIGTTDTDFEGDPSEVHAEPSDIDYLLKAANHYLKGAPLTHDHIISSFAGLRPLQYVAIGDASSVSRNHVIARSNSGLLSIIGGKYTTYRKIAEDVVDRISTRPCKTADRPLPGGKTHPLSSLTSEQLTAKAQELGISLSQLQHLTSTYGSNYGEVLEWIQETENGTHLLSTHHPHTVGELRYAIAIEQVRTLDDWFFRRTYIGLSPTKGKDSVESVARYLAEELGWDKSQTQQEYQQYVNTHR